MKYSFWQRPALAILFGFLFTASAGAQPLRVPYVSLSPTAGPLWVAYEAGFFKRNNVATELLYIPGGSTIHPLGTGEERVH
jgi:ABC-type nitrate/sulfonate/bicarbonate transport system substrate-binding protein